MATGQQYDLGTQPPTIVDVNVLEWIVEHGRHLHPGDVIQMSNGQIYQLHYGDQERGQA